MKKLLITLAILLIGTAVFAQGPWSGFFQPVPKDMLKSLKADSTPVLKWKFRPTVNVVAMKLIPTGDSRVFEMSSLNSAGAGIKYAHFTNFNGAPYNNFSVNGLVLFGVNPGSTTAATVSMAVTFEAFECISAGGGYDFGLKKPMILLGVDILDLIQ